MTHQADSVIVQNSPAHLATQWLLNSQIQNSGVNPKFKGGMHAWFDQEKRSYSFLYSEITGYSINAFLFFYDLLREERFLQKAVEAARWLIEVAYQPKTGVRTRVGEDDGYFSTWTFTFDNWIVVYGLLNLYEIKNDPQYLQTALDIADFLLENVRLENGLFNPVYNIQTKKAEASYDKWSRQPGSFHAKSLFGLLKLFQITKEKRFEEAAIRLVDAVLPIQQFDGRFITHNGSQSTLLHPHLYTLEGLACFGFTYKDFRVIEAVQKGLEWILNQQNSDGSVYCYFESGSYRPCVRVDTLAQTLRIGSILSLYGSSGFESSLDALRSCLVRYQINSGAQRGGFLYGQEENGQHHNHVNSWVSMFAAQALWLYDSFRPEKRTYLLSHFV